MFFFYIIFIGRQKKKKKLTHSYYTYLRIKNSTIRLFVKPRVTDYIVRKYHL